MKLEDLVGHNKTLFAGVIFVTSLFASSCATNLNARYTPINKPDNNPEISLTKSAEPKRNKRASVEFLTDVNAGVEAAAVSGGDYKAGATRKAEFDVLKWKKWFLHFGYQERSLLDFSPSQLDHELEYLGIGREIGKGRIKFFWDHTCYNPSRKLPEEERSDIHWNELGIGYETTGFRFGHKNDGIEFDSGSELLNKLNWKASVSKIWMRLENNYEYMAKLGLRNDVFRHGRNVFYIQPKLNSIYDNRGINLDYGVEIGDRIRLNENVCLIPFLSYKHIHDWYALDDEEDFLSAGLRLEMALGKSKSRKFEEKLEDSAPEKEAKAIRIHIKGGYAQLFGTNDYASDVAINLDILRLGNKTLGLNTYAGILTLPHDLNPFTTNYKIGPFLRFGLDDFDLTISHSYSCLYNVERENVMRDYHLLGLGLRNKDTDSHWKWNAKADVYPLTKNFDYWGGLQAGLGYDFFKKRIIPYASCSVHCLGGKDSVLGYALEAGLKIPGKEGDVRIFLCHQDDFDVFRYGEGEEQLLAGIRFEF